MICPLCKHENVTNYHSDKKRSYLQCNHCQLVFVSDKYILSAAEEKKEYDKHENNMDDKNYRQFLSRMFSPICERVTTTAQGLDFGCGPGPALAAMFSEVGYKMQIFDQFYANDISVLKSGFYHFITATEVIEHIRNPRKILNQLFGLLKPGGILGIMTKLVKSPEAFSKWHYKNDPTHIRFFSEETFKFIAKQQNCNVEFIGNDVIIFTKPQPRETCQKCTRPLSSCICASIKVIKNKFPIIILRHENEVKHPLNTVRIVSAALQNCHVFDGIKNFFEELSPLLKNKQPFLLYPGKNAIHAENFSSEITNAVFIVLDGTWRETRALMRENPWLDSIPRISFANVTPSAYVLRKGPENTISTLEAVAHLLSTLEKNSENYAPLHLAFNAMIEQQINCIAPETFAKNY